MFYITTADPRATRQIDAVHDVDEETFLPRSQPTEGIQNRDAFGSTAVAYYRAHAHAAHHHHDARHAQRLRTTQQHTANSTRDTHCALASVAAALSQIRRKTYVRRSSCGPPHAHKLDKAAVVPQLSHSLTLSLRDSLQLHQRLSLSSQHRLQHEPNGDGAKRDDRAHAPSRRRRACAGVDLRHPTRRLVAGVCAREQIVGDVRG